MIEAAKAYLADDWQKFTSLLQSQLLSRVDILNKINGYLTERSGKQLRPLLCMLAARLCGGECRENTIRFATSCEMIHTATLLHDDVADESPVRRGAPTVSAMVSPTASVLIGDYWLSRAVDLLTEGDDREVIRYFSNCLNDLAEGEMIQIEKAAAMDTCYDDYIQIITRKTASLFMVSVMCGAHSVNCPPEPFEKLREYARYLGLAFQMRDDILDYSPELAIGKPVLQDVRERKITLPLLGAFENAGAAARADIVARIENGQYDGMLEFVRDNGGIEYAQNILEEHTSKAIEALSPFAGCRAKEILSVLADSLSFRKV
ncbi:MAG: polyprenyl synthetase family protein [Bacteroidales bacterium]|nr:polyprenyl synthetase family protein [Candidatus Equibacterium intestinale]